MFPASAIGKKPTISAKTHDLKNKIFLGALTKTGADGDDHLAFFFTWPNPQNKAAGDRPRRFTADKQPDL